VAALAAGRVLRRRSEARDQRGQHRRLFLHAAGRGGGLSTAAFCCVTESISVIAMLTWPMPVLCSLEASVIADMIW
jgi:hypothetical protein